MPTSEINDYFTPASTAKATTHEDLRKLVRQMQVGDVMRFASTAARTTAFDKLSQSPPKGALSYVATTDAYERYDGAGTWDPLHYQEVIDAVEVSKAGGLYTTVSTTELDIGRLAHTNVQILQGQLYRHDLILVTQRSVPGDEFALRLRSGTPVSGTLLSETTLWAEVNALGQEGTAFMVYTPSATATTTIYLSVVRTSGSGTMTIWGQIGTRTRSTSVMSRCGPASRFRVIAT